ncbi:MAG: patatin-like phospholipase family protein [Treponema sp.]|jgi:NTE family protein|nr:patatin-like phospholipase family protein [Treponema sp.]
MKKINKNLKYALVLSGGGARGLVHIGVLSALEAAGYPLPSLIAGCSMGAVVGGLYAAGIGVAELKTFVLEKLDISDFMESPGFKINGPIGKLVLTGQFISNFAVKPGIDSGDKVLRLIKSFVGDKKIEDCPIPFVCNAVDLVSGREMALDSGPLAGAIRASMSFPVFFEPFVEGGLCLVDGGVANNMPVGAARKTGAALGISRILAVDTHSKWQEAPASAYRTGIGVVMRCFEVLIHAAEAYHPQADMVLSAADQTSVFDFDRKKELVALGEAAVRQSAGELDAFFGLGLVARYIRKTKKTCGIRLEGKYAETG